MRLAHILLLGRKNRGVAEAFCLFQCQRQPHLTATFDGEEEAAGSPFGCLKVYIRDSSHLPRRTGDREILGN